MAALAAVEQVQTLLAVGWALVLVLVAAGWAQLAAD